MRTHPFLRAYMAGITVPTMVLLLIMSADAVHRASGGSTIAIAGVEVVRLEHALIFPMAFVPNLWGLWNAIYLAVHPRLPSWPIGLHGAILVPFLALGGLSLLRLLDVVNVSVMTILPVIPIVMAVYYLVWKFVVGFLNREMGIA